MINKIEFSYTSLDSMFAGTESQNILKEQCEEETKVGGICHCGREVTSKEGLMSKVTAKIEKESNPKHTGLWLTIEHENKIENCLWALSEDEVLPIKLACEKYLTRKD